MQMSSGPPGAVVSAAAACDCAATQRKKTTTVLKTRMIFSIFLVGGFSPSSTLSTDKGFRGPAFQAGWSSSLGCSQCVGCIIGLDHGKRHRRTQQVGAGAAPVLSTLLGGLCTTVFSAVPACW